MMTAFKHMCIIRNHTILAQIRTPWYFDKLSQILKINHRNYWKLKYLKGNVVEKYNAPNLAKPIFSLNKLNMGLFKLPEKNTCGVIN